MGETAYTRWNEVQALREENAELHRELIRRDHDKIMADEAARLASIETAKADSIAAEKAARAAEVEASRRKAWETAHSNAGAAAWASGDVDKITHYALSTCVIPEDGSWPEGFTPSYEPEPEPEQPVEETLVSRAIKAAQGLKL